MQIFKKPVSAAQIWIALVLLALIAFGLTALQTQYAREHTALETLLTQASFTASESLRNPSIFTHEETDRIASLQQSVKMLGEIESHITSTKVYLIQAERESALQYMDYLNRIARKLNEVSESEASAKASIEEVQNSLTWLKSSNAAQRTAALQEIERDRTVARYATDLAYQECVLLQSLMEQYPQIYAISNASLENKFLIAPSSWKTFEATLGEDIERRQTRRSQFNAAAN